MLNQETDINLWSSTFRDTPWLAANAVEEAQGITLSSNASTHLEASSALSIPNCAFRRLGRGLTRHSTKAADVLDSVAVSIVSSAGAHDPIVFASFEASKASAASSAAPDRNADRTPLSSAAIPREAAITAAFPG